MRITDEQYAQMEAKMSEAGAEAGRNSAAWWENAMFNATDAANIMRGIDDGDPEILDGLPFLDLSGQWADGQTPWSIYHDVSEQDWPSYDDCTGREELVDVYRDAHDAAVNEAVYAYCKNLTEKEK